MVATLEKARRLFSEDQPSDELAWVEWLSPLNTRLFSVDLYTLLGSEPTAKDVEEFFGAWKATAELDHAPEALEQIERNRRSSRFAPMDEWLNKRTATA